MASSQNNDSVSEGLKKVFTQISQLKLLPDAGQHIQFILLLEQAIMKYLQQQASQAAGVGQAQGQGQPDMGAGGAASAGGPPGMPAPPGPAGFAPGGGAGGGMPGVTQMPNPDELRRVLAGAGGQ